MGLMAKYLGGDRSQVGNVVSNQEHITTPELCAVTCVDLIY